MSSATKEVATLRSGILNTLDVTLNMDKDNPAAANSITPFKESFSLDAFYNKNVKQIHTYIHNNSSDNQTMISWTQEHFLPNLPT